MQPGLEAAGWGYSSVGRVRREGQRVLEATDSFGCEDKGSEILRGNFSIFITNKRPPLLSFTQTPFFYLPEIVDLILKHIASKIMNGKPSQR